MNDSKPGPGARRPTRLGTAPRVSLMLAAWLLAAASPAWAQTLTGVRAAPAQARAGETVRITVDFDVQEQKINCGIRLHFGDGFHEDYKINQASDVPLGVNRRYERAGTYQINVEPQTVRGVLKCMGKPVRTQVSVAAIAPAAVAPASAAAPAPAASVARAATSPAPAPTSSSAAAAKPVASAAAKAPPPACPSGFTLDPKSHNSKTGAYTCKAPAGTAMPAGKLACGPKLAYFESPKQHSVGCRAE